MLELYIKGGSIMIPLTLCSIIAVAIFIEKFISLGKAQKQTRELIDQLTPPMTKRDKESFVAMCVSTEAPLAVILASSFNRRTKSDMISAIETSAEVEIHKLESKLAALSTIAGVAPLLGFLGTVTGMIAAFRQIETMEGAVNPSLLASGIWEALITTVVGLTISIPTIIAYNFLVSKSEKIVLEMRKFAQDAVSFLTQ